jgi:drug/metabolite transporter (DMT)-like permease
MGARWSIAVPGGKANLAPGSGPWRCAGGRSQAGGLAVVSTGGAIALFFAGLRPVGPTAASFLSTLEPVVTVGVAFVVFGESNGPAQFAAGGVVLLAVLGVRAPARIAAARGRPGMVT